MLQQGGSTLWFPCPRSCRQGNQICSRPKESIFKFPTRRETFDWLSPAGNLKMLSAGQEQINVCSHTVGAFLMLLLGENTHG